MSDFIKQWNHEIETQAWIIRFVTFVVMVIAFEMIVQPLSVSADLLRVFNYCTCCLGTLLDDIAQCLIHFFAFCWALFLWFLTFAVAWVVARPLLGICVLAVDILAIVGLTCYLRRRKSARQVADNPPLMEAGMAGYPIAGSASLQQRQAVVPSTRQLMTVTCPAGVGPGSQVSIVTPNGQQATVTVPQGVYAGQQFSVEV
jgi:hypothetical protein